MRKIVLNEKQYKIYLESLIKESIISEKGINNFARKKVDSVVKYLQDKAKSGDESLMQKAKENGINIDSLKGEISSDEYKQNVQNQIDELVAEKNQEINDWVKEYLPILREQYGNSKNFSIGKEVASNKRDEEGNLINIDTKGSFDSLDDETKAQVYAIREFLDKEGLTFLYRKATKPASIVKRYGVELEKVDYTTPVDEINIDFSNVSASEINDYYTGTRVKWINEKIKALGYEGVDKDKKVDFSSDAWNGANGVEGGKDIALEGKLKMVAGRYVQRKYGMEFTFGQKNDIFSFGNKKINDDTLIVNFTAAMRCPAWNECLLKDACYARNTERGYDNALNRNLRTNLIWEQTKEDPQLMELMAELMRATMLDYKALSTWTKKHPQINVAEPTLFEKKQAQVAVSADELCHMTISEIQEKYGDEAIELLRKKRKGNLIRLNEDGDFIGQWLVDAWDKWAEDFKIVGINVVAYTCRALNYEKIKNIILNISQENLVKNQKSKVFAHYFYAVEPITYDRLNETYSGPNYDLYIDQETQKITPVYRKLIDENGELLGYYYKCPCGRGKFKYVPIDENEINSKDMEDAVEVETIKDAREDSPKIVKCQNSYYKMIRNDNVKERADCYRCRICYGRDEEEAIKTEDGESPDSSLPVYVFVSAHGANKDEFEEGNEIANRARKVQGKTPEEWASIQKGAYKKDYSPSMENTMQRLAESVGATGEEDKVAINQIVKNTTESVANMMREHNGMLSENKDAFFKMLEKINNPYKY